MQQALDDREAQKAWENAKKKELVPKLQDLFYDMDSDGSGGLDLDEIKAAPPEVIDQLQQIGDMKDVEELFHMLDYDGSGELGIDEFCEGMMQAQSDKPLEF